MKTTGLMMFCVMLSCAASRGMDSRSAELTINDFNTPIRVLLDRDSRSARVRSTLNRLFLKEGNALGWTTLDDTARVSLDIKLGKPRLLLNGRVIAAESFYLRGGPRPSDSLIYRTDRYRGAVKFTVARGKLMVTNILPLEDYLAGILASEMSPSWEMEALKAQAVASRTYAYYMIQHPKHGGYDLEDSTQDQVYSGADAEHDRVAQAIAATSGEYLGLEGEPVKSFFHSRCGGTTETARSVWKIGAQGERGRVRCPGCQHNPYTWKATLGFNELLRLLDLPSKETLSIAPLERTPSGRIASLRLAAGGESKTVTSDQFRSLVGYTRIKSALFDWRVKDGEIEFEGRGAGHGVGMCQWGAKYLARKGKNYAEILGHYYPGMALFSLKPGLGKTNKRLD